MSKKKEYQDSVVTDSDCIRYQASIEGYGYENDSMPRLIDFKAHYRFKYTQTNQVITHQIITPHTQNKWHISPSVTFGYDPINKQWGGVIGIGVNYNI